MSTPKGSSWLEQERAKGLHNVFVVPQSTQLKGMHTVIRDKTSTRADFIFQSDRLIRLVIEEALSLLPTETKRVVTPTGEIYEGLRFMSRVCVVSIPRSGDTMERGVRQIIRDVRIGKILIQRDEKTHQPKLVFVKLPQDIEERICLLVDPMLATGGSAIRAIEILQQHGVPQERIIFACLIAAPEGLREVALRFPGLRIVTSAVDDRLNEHAYILPGIGDFGDRYFGTIEESKL